MEEYIYDLNSLPVTGQARDGGSKAIKKL